MALSPETIEKIRRANLISNRTPEFRARMSEIAKNRWRRKTEEEKALAKASFLKIQNHSKGEMAANWRGGNITVTCNMCKKRFDVRRSLPNTRFCSISCARRYNATGSKNNFWKGGEYFYDPKAARAFSQRRRQSRLRGAEGSHTREEWELLKRSYNYACASCLVAEPTVKLTEDHIIPISKGGSDNIENIQPLCGPCNSKKSNKVASV